MLKGFKEFVLRGSVIDLAVAVVIGAAFTAIVNTVVESVFNPLIGALFQAESLNNAFVLSIPLLEGTAELKFGAIIAALIQFLLTATVLYFIFVMPINHLRRIGEQRDSKNAADEAAAEKLAETELSVLLEIKELLKAQQK